MADSKGRFNAWQLNEQGTFEVTANISLELDDRFSGTATMQAQVKINKTQNNGTVYLRDAQGSSVFIERLR
ncbi:hypothetical protein [Nonlabens xiamenensis]|uniref:hypothetical protein n=1 Tax=Nonlabens xiamenensis TaxID=2341043 RepID=UPI000F60B709|nr:hypothetical protein [Nonlabens xiamenensis]